MNKSRKASLGLLAGLLVAAGGVVTGTQPAMAARGDCASSRLCIWYNQNFTGTIKSYSASNPNLGGDSDEAHSIYNHTSVAWVVYDDADYSTNDRRFCVKAGQYTSDLGQASYKFGDKITSISRRSNNTCPAGVPTL
jgi:hypothetical protein